MKVLWLILAGVIGGTMGAMGLGGGTLLMPILTLLLGVPQRVAAWVNLISFLPVAVVAVFVHSKNRMIEWRKVLRFVLVAGVGAALAFALGKGFSDKILRQAFGWLLILLGSISLFLAFVGYYKRKDKN